mgnify:CR=1 FL=1
MPADLYRLHTDTLQAFQVQQKALHTPPPKRQTFDPRTPLAEGPPTTRGCCFPSPSLLPPIRTRCPTMPTVPKGSLVLISGPSGFLGARKSTHARSRDTLSLTEPNDLVVMQMPLHFLRTEPGTNADIPHHDCRLRSAAPRAWVPRSRYRQESGQGAVPRRSIQEAGVRRGQVRVCHRRGCRGRASFRPFLPLCSRGAYRALTRKRGDFWQAGAFDEAIKGVDAFLHTVSGRELLLPCS